MRNSQGENVFINPTQCQNNAVRPDITGINQQQYQESRHQLYNPQQSIRNIAQPGVPQGQEHMNPGGAYNEQFSQQNNVISGQPCVNTGFQGQQWMGQ